MNCTPTYILTYDKQLLSVTAIIAVTFALLLLWGIFLSDLLITNRKYLSRVTGGCSTVIDGSCKQRSYR